MVNQLKIITMTRLALYDKHEGVADRIANDYFRHDYIYRNNLGTRLAVGLGSILVLVVYWVRAFLLYEMDLFEINIQQYATDSLMFVVAVLAVYSLIGTIQGTRQYYLVQKRLAQYQALVRQLERLEERTHRVYEDEPEAEPETRRIPPPPKLPRSGYPVRTRPAGEAVPPVRLDGQGPVLASGENGAEAATGYTRPPRPAPSEGTMPPRPTSSGPARPSRPVPADATRPDATRAPRYDTAIRPPRPASSDTPPPRPAPPGYARPHPPMSPERAAMEETRIPRPSGKPVDS